MRLIHSSLSAMMFNSRALGDRAAPTAFLVGERERWRSDAVEYGGLAIFKKFNYGCVTRSVRNNVTTLQRLAVHARAS